MQSDAVDAPTIREDTVTEVLYSSAIEASVDDAEHVKSTTEIVAIPVQVYITPPAMLLLILNMTLPRKMTMPTLEHHLFQRKSQRRNLMTKHLPK